MAVEYIGTNQPDGACFGLATTEKIAFLGSTPVVQQTGATTPTDTATLITAVSAINDALIAFGLVTDEN